MTDPNDTVSWTDLFHEPAWTSEMVDDMLEQTLRAGALSCLKGRLTDETGWSLTSTWPKLN